MLPLPSEDASADRYTVGVGRRIEFNTLARRGERPNTVGPEKREKGTASLGCWPSRVLLGDDGALAHGANGLVGEPGIDAGSVEGVDTGQHPDLFLLFEFLKTHTAPKEKGILGSVRKRWTIYNARAHIHY